MVYIIMKELIVIIVVVLLLLSITTPTREEIESLKLASVENDRNIISSEVNKSGTFTTNYRIRRKRSDEVIIEKNYVCILGGRYAILTKSKIVSKDNSPIIEEKKQ